VDSARKTKNPLAAVSAVFWIALALLVCYGATLLGIGSVSDPGSGFIFFWSGLIMAILALTLLADWLRGASEEDHEFDRTNWPKIFVVLTALVLYGLLLEKLGFILSTFALLSFLLTMSDETKWPSIFTVASAAAFISFAIFDLWLKIKLPKGILGF
jgi:putative tricarboxylic transport membrane protein